MRSRMNVLGAGEIKLLTEGLYALHLDGEGRVVRVVWSLKVNRAEREGIAESERTIYIENG